MEYELFQEQSSQMTGLCHKMYRRLNQPLIPNNAYLAHSRQDT